MATNPTLQNALHQRRARAKKRATRERLNGAKLALMLEARLASIDAD
jgi:hypothetical protein